MRFDASCSVPPAAGFPQVWRVERELPAMGSDPVDDVYPVREMSILRTGGWLHYQD